MKSSNSSSHTTNEQLKAKTLGPVQNPEAHVPAEWWRGLFTGLYLKTDGDVVMDQELTCSEVDLIESVLQLQPADCILDLCCGQGRHTLELARRGFHHVEGLDRSQSLIQRARRKAKSENLTIRFREGDARRLPFPDASLDVVIIMGNSFGYFDTSSEDLRVLYEIARVLRDNGRLLIDVADGEYLRQNFTPRAWEWIDAKTFVCRERSLASDGRRLISREIVTHAEQGVLADQFYAERLYSQSEISSLLREAGFQAPSLHTEIATQSQRNQDLGMMARRLLLSSSINKHSAFNAAPQTKLRRIGVVMGDPSLMDEIKPDAVFDEDDYHTIEALKQALAQCDGYSFSYFNNHQSLISDLEKNRDEIDYVLNLCDEGFYNQPRWELHVPAILETLGLAYTGGGPQCLAYCYDKSLVRGVAKELGIRVPAALIMTPADSIVDLPFPFPAIIKPNFGDSSFGITQESVVSTPADLLRALASVREWFGYDKPVLVEAFLPGKDLSVGLVGNPPADYRFLPIVEEDYSVLPEGLPPICGYEAKWDPQSPYWQLRSIRADLPNQTVASLQAACLRLYERLECRDYVRFDWRLDHQGQPCLLEVNPNPGWCWDGHLAKMATLEGLSYPELLLEILQTAERRIQQERRIEALSA
jgi:D-alanine-D-alanine ligase